MISKNDLKKVSSVAWEIPKSFRADMRVPARVYASEAMLEELFHDRSLEQLVNVATLPGIVGHALVMPDAHEGYGFPIGGVAATRWPDGVISPGGIGYDINCGVRLLKSALSFADVEPKLDTLAKELYREIPSGVGKGGRLKLDAGTLDAVLKQGAPWVVEQGYGEAGDLAHIESGGVLQNADPRAVSDHAKKRGGDQLGTMGAGNHFVEVDRVEEIYDTKAAEAFGLFQDQAVVLVHTGSRGLGHQVATDYIRIMLGRLKAYGIVLPDRELACLPFSSPEGTAYFNAMAAAANFAWANRQMISHEVRASWNSIFGKAGGTLSPLYDVAHNIAKVEEYEIEGKPTKVIVHRKGATRAFGPGHPELAQEYCAIGQPVIIPGSMGTASYVLVGTKEGARQSFSSSCHGAGRRMSRHAAKRQIRGGVLRRELEEAGVHIQTGSLSGLAEEAPFAYKDVDDVVGVIHEAGIAKKVARLRPVAVVKG